MHTPPKIWIGKTGLIAATLWKQIDKLRTAKDPIERRYLFTGPPGLGKTEVAEHFASALTGDSVDAVHAGAAVNVEVINGQSTSIEVVRRWREAGNYRSLFGPCRVILCDEIDAMSIAAANEMRTYLDRLPLATVFLATTNKNVDELQPQLGSRFKVHYFKPVPAPDILRWITTAYQLGHDTASHIATSVQGNVRAAKIDAINYLESHA